jgi:hypothetical protein
VSVFLDGRFILGQWTLDLGLKVPRRLTKWQKANLCRAITVVDSPDEYYTIVAFLGLFEFLLLGGDSVTIH